MRSLMIFDEVGGFKDGRFLHFCVCRFRMNDVSGLVSFGPLSTPTKVLLGVEVDDCFQEHLPRVRVDTINISTLLLRSDLDQI